MSQPLDSHKEVHQRDMVRNVDIEVRFSDTSRHEELEIIIVAELSSADLDHLHILVLYDFLLDYALQVDVNLLL
jgi:hypothetical protein